MAFLNPHQRHVNFLNSNFNFIKDKKPNFSILIFIKKNEKQTIKFFLFLSYKNWRSSSLCSHLSHTLNISLGLRAKQHDHSKIKIKRIHNLMIPNPTNPNPLNWRPTKPTPRSNPSNPRWIKLVRDHADLAQALR